MIFTLDVSKIQKGILIKTGLVGLDQFKCAACIGADLKRIFIAVVSRPNFESQPDLFEVVDTRDFLRLALVLISTMTIKQKNADIKIITIRGFIFEKSVWSSSMLVGNEVSVSVQNKIQVCFSHRTIDIVAGYSARTNPAAVKINSPLEHRDSGLRQRRPLFYLGCLYSIRGVFRSLLITLKTMLEFEFSFSNRCFINSITAEL